MRVIQQFGFLRFFKKSRIKIALVTFLCGGFIGCANMTSEEMTKLGTALAVQALSGQSSQNVRGLKQMMDLSSDRATSILGQTSLWSLGLPKEAQDVVKVLRYTGLGKYVNNVESSIKQAAAQSARASAPIFKQAITQLTIFDAINIIRGGPTAATQYFRSKTESSLRASIQPVLKNQLNKTGYYKQMNDMLTVYDRIPLRNKPNLDVEKYILDQTMNNLFAKMGKEETLIRQDPLGRGSALINTILKQ